MKHFQSEKTHRLVLTAIFFSVAIVLSILENMLPPVTVAVLGVRMGLSNIAVMYVLFFIGKKEAYGVAVLKGVFVFATRGAVASALSIMGGLISVTIMVLLMIAFKEKISYFLLSVAGAVFHNLGQLFAIVLIYTSVQVVFYLPVLLISGVVAGGITSVLLKAIMPAFKRITDIKQ